MNSLNPLVVFLAALADSVNPCAISVLLITLGFLISLKKTPQEIIKIGGAYIAAIFVVYTMVGVGVLQVLDFFGVPSGMAKFGALLLFIFALLQLAEELIPNFPIKLAIPQFAKGTLAKYMQQASIPAAFVLGSFVALYEFPCTGGPYLFILSLLHDHATFWSGFAYLVFYNFVFVLPLIVILVSATNKNVLDKVSNWKKGNMKRFNIISATFLLLLSAAIFFQDYINTWITGLLS